MKPVDQALFGKDYGDCQRACVASLLEFPIEAVPHFRYFADNVWGVVYVNFLWNVGFDYFGTIEAKDNTPDKQYSVDSCFIGSVASKNYTDRTHAVIIGEHGLVLHDPNPKKQYQGVNVIETGELQNWELIKPREEENGSTA